MAGGEVCYKLFTKVTGKGTAPTRPDLPAFKFYECCFSLPALADTSGDDLYRNDKHSILGKYDKDLYSAVTIFIQKYEADWVDKVEVVDNSYGVLSALGTYTDTTLQLNYVGLFADWQLILNAFGEGSYRFRFKEIDFLSIETETLYPFEFCLRTYTEDRADLTTRFSWNNQGFGGNYEDDLDTWDYSQIPGGWDNQMRLPTSFFGYNKSEYSRDFVRYQNGQQQWLKDEQVEVYTWNSGHYPAPLHDFLKTNMIQSNELLVTDFNSNNPNIIKDKAIKADGNYEPEWQYNNKRAFVNVDFVQEYQNRIKKRC